MDDKKTLCERNEFMITFNFEYFMHLSHKQKYKN